MTTNVPAPTFGPTGFVAPEESAILEGVMEDIDAAFGGGLNPALDTPQGQLATSLTAVIGQANDQFVNITNQVDPAYAEGRMQDAIARIYFLERNPAQATLVDCLCTGLPGTAIPAGSLAQSTDGNQYVSQVDAEIQPDGTVTIQFACATEGPITCPANSVTTIYRAIPGWDTITNPTAGVTGANVESRSAFEARRAASVAGNSRGALPSILGAVLDVDGVLDAYVTENTTNAPLSIGGVLLVAKSLYVAALGGDDEDVARAIWSRKAPGCAYNGDTTVTVEDQNSGYSPPYPSYEVKFQRPTTLPILFAVEIAAGPQVPANAETLIQNAIIAAFNGEDNNPPARIGSVVYATRYVGPVTALGAWAQVISLVVGSNNTSTAVGTASISGTTMTVTVLTSGSFLAGQTVSDAAGEITAGTRIVSQLTGTPGGAGTYQLTNPQTVTSRTVTTSEADANLVQVNIDQSPAAYAGNIVVTLV